MERRYNISVSLKGYTDKNSIKWQTIKYKQWSLTIDELTRLIKYGYCFCHCFNTRSNAFGLNEKTDTNFREANMVFVDIDDCIISMSDFVTKLSHKPTIAYTTPNNHSEKSNYLYRFRLCYIIESPIKDIDTYKRVYEGIMQHLSKDVEGFVCKDNCGRSPSQQFSGNGSGNCEVYASNIIYDSQRLAISETKIVQQIECNKRRNAEVVANDNQMLSDLSVMRSSDFIAKYRTIYSFFESTPLEYHDGYAILPKDYTMIKRAWYWDDFNKKDGTVKYFGRPKRLRDGDNRKKKLYTSALIRKQILPSVSFEHLLFNLVWDREQYYDNSDNELNNNRLIDICRRVIATPLEEIKLKRYRPKEYEVDKEYCREHGITPNEMKNRVKRQLKDMEIGESYDCSMSVSENLIMLKELGVKVGKSRLYEWCRENGIETNPKRTQHTQQNTDSIDLKVCTAQYHACSPIEKKKVFKEKTYSPSAA
ncbi:MAG: hypothetical protein MR822_00345 [Bacteroidales bacterium]|nr:hypothetical protein [Bacteroidales bacterium]MDD6961107.1 hypothetical protein [Bacteroidales bacterium]MDY6186890.1 hypothetical protein [Muribaculaceae bacterium]